MTSSTPAPSTGVRTLRVTDIGEYIRHHSCARRLKLGQEEKRLRKDLPFYSRLFNPIDPALRAVGAAREDEAEQDLITAGYLDLTEYQAKRKAPALAALVTQWSDFCRLLSVVPLGTSAYGREIGIAGRIGEFEIEGRIDFVLLEWREGNPILRLVECKASRKDKTYQRIQVAAYLTLVSKAIASSGLAISGFAVTQEAIEASVARIDEGTERIQPLPPLPSLHLEMECSDLFRMLAADGQICAVLDSDLARLPYNLEAKCDHCKFNVVCLPEAGRSRALELLGVDPATCRAMRSVGIMNLRDLELLDLNGPSAKFLRSTPGFSANLLRLQRLAAVRSTTLPGGAANPDEYQVSRLPWHPVSQCPEYAIGGLPVVRIYLGVHYDYVENRVGALAAHITTSDWNIHTPFEETSPGKWKPSPEVVEQRKVPPVPPSTKPKWEQRAIENSRNVCMYQPSPWSNNIDTATGQEDNLLQSFFNALINAVAILAPAKQAPIHIYVWSRGEVSQLIEACLRANTRTLRSLQELLGCREPLEQLVFSCIQEDVDRGYALGWTGRGLSVASTLRWQGQAYHWTRRVGKETVELDWVFRQDLFDFKTKLDLTPSGEWAEGKVASPVKHTFEIRSRFNDTLTAPYWRAVWGTLTDPATPGLDAQQREQLKRYYEAAQPNYLEEYLIARVQALRWIEGFIPKNADLSKPPLDIHRLKAFTLGIETPAAAAIDFLRLDHHVKMAGWIATHLAPTADRVASGISLPLRNVHVNAAGELEATIDVATYGTDLAALRNRGTVREFARLSPRFPEPSKGQTLGQLLRGGSTCSDVSVDWITGKVTMTPIYAKPGQRYIAQSRGYQPGEDLDFATLDESVSDFVSPKVDSRLSTVAAHVCYTFFDPRGPVIPKQPGLPASVLAATAATLKDLRIRPSSGLEPDQLDAAIRGLQAKIQLLQGPPGTGKTGTTSASVLARAATRVGSGGVILIAAHTHTAVNELLARIQSLHPEFERAARKGGLSLPRIELFRVEGEPLPGINLLSATSAVRALGSVTSHGVAIVGGTTNALLKLADHLDKAAAFGRKAAGFQANLLVIDEASMMVYSNFLALTSLVTPDAQFMLAGDHRQLAPIVAHDWEQEDRYPIALYQPFVSAFEAVKSIKQKCSLSDEQVLWSSLRFTFRLPEIVRDLIRPVYQQDNIDLTGGVGTPSALGMFDPGNDWTKIWADKRALYLVVHNEAESAKANPLEVDLITAILDANATLAPESVVVMTPHRAQRSLLKQRLDGRPEIRMVETVEKMQGGECQVVLISATASDSAAITRNAEFILDLNRANVAFSRTQHRLIVVCARSLLENVPADLEDYQSAMLWKAIRELCTDEIAKISIGRFEAYVFSYLAAPSGT